jgi:hypothetical protein
MRDRLRLSVTRLQTAADGLRQVASFPIRSARSAKAACGPTACRCTRSACPWA